MSQETQPPVIADDEINLRMLFLSLWRQRKIIVVSSCLTLLLATVYAYLIAKPVFESSALLLPTQTTATADMGAAAALLGGKKTGSADVDLYQSLLTSRTVLRKLLRAPIKNHSDTGNGNTEPLYKILRLDTTKTDKVDGAITAMAKSVMVGTKESGAGGILEIKFTAATPWLAQQIGNSLLEIGQEELRLVRIERSNLLLSRLNVAVAKAKSEWDTTTRTLTFYKDRNRSAVLPEQLLEIYRLEIEKSAKEQKYLLAKREFESQLLERTKAAPPMMILDPANLPSSKSKPRRSMLLMMGLFLGLFGSCAGILGWRAFVTSEVTAPPQLQ